MSRLQSIAGLVLLAAGCGAAGDSPGPIADAGGGSSNVDASSEPARPNATGNIDDPKETIDSGTTSGDAATPLDAGAAFPSSLVLTSLGGYVFEDCWPLKRGGITQLTYTYKKVHVPSLGRYVDLRAYVFLPPGFAVTSKYAAIALFHGGGWMVGAPTYWFPAANYFAARGMVAVSFQYRLSSVHKVPSDKLTSSASADARSAIRWMKKYATAFGIDTNRIATSGDSAGGYLAIAPALIGTGSDESGADALISTVPNVITALYPVLNPAVIQQYSPGGGTGYTLIDKLTGKNLPQTTILQGDVDTVTPHPSAVTFCATANAIGTTCWYNPFAGQGHAFMSDPEKYKVAVASIDAFLINFGFTGGDASKLYENVSAAASHCRMDANLLKAWSNAFGYGPDCVGGYGNDCSGGLW